MEKWRALEVIGKDAQDYLQRLTTLPVKKIQPGDGAPALLLDARAKAFGAFTLLCVSLQQYILVFESEEEFARVRDELERLHFSEALELRERPGEGGVMQEKLSLSSFASFEENLLRWRWRAPDRVGVFGSHLPAILGKDDFEALRVEVAQPKWRAEYGPETTVLDAGLLERLPGNKGCYPGQEVVEKSLSVGHPARAMIQVKSDGAFQLGGALFVEAKEVGKITSLSPRGNYALAIVQWKYREIEQFIHDGRKIIRCHR